jgi:hypothetical protein
LQHDLEQKTEGRRNTALFCCFALALLVMKFFFHEFWKDEWQAWFVATDTHSLRDLWDMLPVEGHPVLYFLFLRFVHFLNQLLAPALRPEYAFQIANAILTLASAWIFFRKFRYPFAVKLILGFSYFFFFEYGVLNRGYALVILLLFMLVPYLEKPREHLLRIGFLLFLLTQTEIYGLFAAGAVLFWLMWYFIGTDDHPLSPAKFFLLASFLGGLVLFVLSLLPSEGVSALKTEQETGLLSCFTFLFSHTLSIGLDPPPPTSASTSFSIVSLLLSIVLLSLIVVVMKKSIRWMVSYGLFLVCLLVFHTWVYKGGPRQWGMHFVFLLFVLNFIPLAKSQLNSYVAGIALAALVGLGQFTYAVRISVMEKKYLFSNAIETGHYIRQTISPDAPVIGINKAFCTPVIGYCNHKCFSLPDEKLFSYSMFREKVYMPSEKEIFSFLNKNRFTEGYVLSYKPLNASLFPDLVLLRAFDKPSIREENYYLYKVNPIVEKGRGNQ